MIKEGDKIWEVEYLGGFEKKRSIRSYKIKEVKDGKIFVSGTAWEIPIEQIGETYYLSKESAIIGAIRNNARPLLRTTEWEEAKDLSAEVGRLSTMLKSIQED